MRFATTSLRIGARGYALIAKGTVTVETHMFCGTGTYTINRADPRGRDDGLYLFTR